MPTQRVGCHGFRYLPRAPLIFHIAPSPLPSYPLRRSFFSKRQHKHVNNIPGSDLKRPSPLATEIPQHPLQSSTDTTSSRLRLLDLLLTSGRLLRALSCASGNSNLGFPQTSVNSCESSLSFALPLSLSPSPPNSAPTSLNPYDLSTSLFLFDFIFVVCEFPFISLLSIPYLFYCSQSFSFSLTNPTFFLSLLKSRP